jgi:hypothetical protein
LPLDVRAGVLEVLLEEPNAMAMAPGLQRVDPVTVEARTFNRFLAQDVAQGGVLRIQVPSAAGGARRAWIAAMLAAVTAAMALMLLRAVRGARRVPSISTRHQPESPSQRLARLIAELDARVETTPNVSDGDRESYARRRAALKADLARALDAERMRS